MKKLIEGTRVKVSNGAGLHSNKLGTVIRPIPWQAVPGMYGAPDPVKERCIRLDDGKVIYMFTNRLIVV